MRRALLIALLAAACGDDGPIGPRGPHRGKPIVCAVNYPLAFFAERIGGEAVEVRFPAPADVDPAFWRPGDEIVTEYQGADVILLNGAAYAQWTNRVSLPLSRCVDTSAAFADRLIPEEGRVTHGHGPGGAHEHGGVAFTTWLDLTLAAQQAEAVRDALVRVAPEHRAAMNARHEALAAELRELDRAMAAAAPKEPVIASHPVYQYWARRYAVDLASVHFEPDELPDEAGWRELERLLASHPARLMVWEATPRLETAARLEQLGLRSIVVAPCGNRPPHGDFCAAMRANIERLR